MQPYPWRGAWLADGEGREVGPGQLVIVRWTALQVRTFDEAAAESLSQACKTENPKPRKPS
jgi:hypothetical protein